MILDNSIQQLVELNKSTDYITSLYLKLGPDERNDFKFKTVLKNLIKKAKNNYSYLRDDTEIYDSISKDFKKIENFIGNTKNIEGSRGLAIFSCSVGDFWTVFNLPYVNKDRLLINQYPHVGELINMYQRYGNILCLAIDKQKARMFTLTPSATKEVSGFLYPGASRTQRFQSTEGKFKKRVSSTANSKMVSQGYGEYGFNRTIENDVQQHFKYVSDKIFEYHQNNNFDWLILAGSNQTVNDFSNHVHTYIKPKLLGNIKLDVDKLQIDKITETALSLLDNLRYKNNCGLIEEFEEKLSSGLAVNGIEQCLNALYNGQSRTLLVNEDFRQSGYQCPKSNILLLDKTQDTCPESQTPYPIEDVVNYIIEEAYSQKCDVDIVYDSKLKKKIDGMGAILRFKL